MEKGNGPPPDTEGTLEIPDIPAPPYPGPPLDPSVLTSQPNPVDHPAAENDNQPVSKSVHQEHSQGVDQQQPHSSTQHVGQESAQPVPQQYPQPGVQQYPQPGVQQYPQPGVQQYPQPGIQQYPQPAQQPVVQYVATTQQNQILHSGNQVLLVQHMPTDVAGSMLCPHCKNTIVTSIEYKVGMLTWIIFGVLLLFCWPCSCIPFCVNSCKDVQHSCPQCNNVLHLYKRR